MIRLGNQTKYSVLVVARFYHWISSCVQLVIIFLILMYIFLLGFAGYLGPNLDVYHSLVCFSTIYRSLIINLSPFSHCSVVFYNNYKD